MAAALVQVERRAYNAAQPTANDARVMRVILMSVVDEPPARREDYACAKPGLGPAQLRLAS